jgi:hypothetical protein
MVSYFQRNMQGLDPINEKARLLPPQALTRLRYQGTASTHYISFNCKVPVSKDVQCLFGTIQTLRVRRYVTSRKMAGSIPDEAIDFFFLFTKSF